MALKLFSYDGDLEINDTSNKIVAFHDATDGTYQVAKYYVSNIDNPLLGYSTINISLQSSTGSALSLSEQSGIFYQVIGVASDDLDDAIAPAFWENVPVNNSIYLTDIIAGIESNRYFALRTYVPRATAPKYITEAKLIVSANEVS
jgi:hypothetical protein